MGLLRKIGLLALRILEARLSGERFEKPGQDGQEARLAGAIRAGEQRGPAAFDGEPHPGKEHAAASLAGKLRNDEAQATLRG